MILLINYANAAFAASQRLNSSTGKTVGAFDAVVSYSPKDIARDFFERNRRILSRSRGNGYWLWKPYFILRSLELLNPGDFLFYGDSGSYFIRPITPLVEISSDTGQEIIVFELPYVERIWTKRDAFILLDCDGPEYAETPQRLASFSLWRKSSSTMDFAGDYLRHARDERIVTDIENQCGHPNHPGFREHRHDQSIFSLLSKRNGLVAFRDPSQFGNAFKPSYANSNYEQLIEHTRKRNGWHALSLRKAMRRVGSLMSHAGLRPTRR